MNRLLLDTHVALWWFSAHPRLAEDDRALIASSECYLSAASLWEVAIKFRLGKLPVTPDRLLTAARSGAMRLLPIAPEHTVATAHLHAIHHDPFDRLLLAQARLERLELLTADGTLAKYGEAVRIAAA